MLKYLIGFFALIFNLTILGGLTFVFLISLLISYYSKDLPTAEEIENYKPQTLSRIYDSEGNILGVYGKKKRVYTPISDVPDLVKNAFISAEDKNFYFHPGYDPISLIKAIMDAFRGKKLRGASTITQQVMKNFLLSNERTGKRKIKEIILASRIEKVLDKNEILNVYLNEIYLGQGAYGITAAAITYFDKPLNDLNISEVAYLAALPKAPSFYHPIKQKERSIERRNFVIKELYENGYITASQAEVFSAYDLSTSLTRNNNELALRKTLRKTSSFFSDQVNSIIQKKYPQSLLETEGLTIMATLDPKLQRLAEQALQEQLLKFDQSNRVYRGPLSTIPIEKIKSISEVTKYLGEFNDTVPVKHWKLAVVRRIYNSYIEIYVKHSALEITIERLQADDFKWIEKRKLSDNSIALIDRPGEIFSVGDIIYVQADLRSENRESYWRLRQVPEIQGAFMAMEPNTGKVLAMQGGFSYQLSKFNRASQAKRQPGSVFKPFVYLAALENGFFPNSIVVDAPISINQQNGVWRPKNVNSDWFGVAPLRKGLEHSKNLMTVRLAKEIGMREVARYANLFGIYKEMPQYLSYSLGAGETTLLDLVRAYSMLANGGLEIEPTLFELIQNRYGETVYKHGFLRCLGCSVTNLDTATKPIFLNLGSRLIDSVSIYQINSMLQGVVERGTASKTVGRLGVNLAGKTGTTNESKDLWFIGYTPDIVVGCYIGYDRPKSLGPNASGGKYCGEAFANFYRKAFTLNTIDWKAPKATKFVKIDYDTGKVIKEKKTKKIVISELYRMHEQPSNALVSTAFNGTLKMGQDLLFLEKDVIESGSGPLQRSFGSIISGDQY